MVTKYISSIGTTDFSEELLTSIWYNNSLFTTSCLKLAHPFYEIAI